MEYRTSRRSSRVLRHFVLGILLLHLFARSEAPLLVRDIGIASGWHVGGSVGLVGGLMLEV